MKKVVAVILALGSVLNLLLFAGVRVLAASWQSPMVEQEAAERWQGESETPMAQVSAFLTEDNALYADDMDDIEDSVEEAMSDAGIDADVVAWVWAASGQTTGTVEYDENSVTVQITVVQGDFFIFHNLNLVSGSYLTSSDLNHDRVVIDELTAWNLFGSSNVSGMTLTYNDQLYYIAGVVEPLEGSANETTWGDDTPHIYMFSDGDQDGEEVAMTTLEAVIPEPVEDFAISTLQDALGWDEDDDTMEFVTNTDRFSFSNSLSLLADFTMRGVQTAPINYPYWENAARLTENRMMILTVLSIVFLCWPAVSLIVLILWYNKHRKWHLSSIKLYGSYLVDQHRSKVYYSSEHDEWKI